MAVRQQQRRGTAAQWTSANPILSPGEIGFEIDTNKFKIGDGSSRWASLIYFTADAASAIEDLIGGAPGLLDTLNELAAAVGDDANFFSTVTTNIATAKSEAISTASSDATTKVSAEAALRVSGDAASVLTAAADATTKANAAQAAAEATAAAALSSAISTEVSNRNTAISTAVDSLVDGAPALLNTLNELAAAINDDANYTTTITTALGTKANAADVATALAGKEDALTSAQMTNKVVTGVSGSSYGLVGTSEYLDVKDTNGYNKEIELDIAAVEAKLTTDGYAKQSDIATAKSVAEATASADATTKANAAQSAAAADATTKANAAQAAAEATASADATAKANAAYSSAESAAALALSSHESDTTDIHGITDTAELATKAFAASLLTGAAKTNITISGDKNGLTITAENGVADSTTDDLTEGAINKYFSDALAVTAIQNAMNDKSFEAMIDGGGV